MKRYPLGVIRWRVRVHQSRHVLNYYPILGTADLFVHASDSTIIEYSKDICTGLRNAANFARRIGAHLTISDYRAIGLTSRKPNLGKGRWAKR